MPDPASPTEPASRNGWRPLAAAWPLVRRHRGLVAGWLLFLGLASLATLALPVAVRQMIDHGFSAADADTVDRYFLGLFGVALVLALATSLRFWFVSLLGERVTAELRQAVYDRLLGLDQAFYERTRTGELLSRLTTDAELVQVVVGSSASVAVRSAVMLVGASAMLVVTSPRLAGFAALVDPAGAGADAAVRAAACAGSRARTRTASPTPARSPARPSTRCRRCRPTPASRPSRRVSPTRWQRTLETARRRIRTRALLTALVIVLVFGAITGVLWMGARSVMGGAISTGTLSQFVLFAVLAAGSVGALTETWGDVLRAAGAMERIGELLAEQPAIREPPHPPTFVRPRARRAALRARALPLSDPGRPRRAGGLSLEVRARGTGRAGRSFRRRQEHGLRAAAALLRPRVRSHHPRRARPAPAADRASCAARRRWCRRRA